MPCTYSRSPSTGKCRSRAEHLRHTSGRRRRGCTHSRHPTTRRCRSQREHDAALRRVRRSLAKRKLASLARARGHERRRERAVYGDDGYVPFEGTVKSKTR